MKKYLAIGASLALLTFLSAGLVAAQESSAAEKTQSDQQAQQGETTQQAAPQPAADPEEVSAAQAVLSANTPQEREKLATAFLDKYPQSAFRGKIFMAAAEAYRMENDYDKAIDYAKRALEINPDDGISLIVVADALSEGAQKDDPNYTQELVEAEGYAKHALDVIPGMFKPEDRRPSIPPEQYELQEKYMEAQPHATLGYIYLRQGKNAQALQELKTATDLNQFRPSPADFERLGVAQQLNRQYDAALASYQRCVDLSNGRFLTCQRRIEILDEALKKAKSSTKPAEQQPQE